ncbi:MAG: ABC transporter ATP-binding protein [Limnochordales bacterium]|nr:ABC transporter ATP-binding protein [Limnochordales bacterium]
MLTVQDVVSGYGLSQVLHGISLEVGENEVVALIGRNGAGKSTLLRTIIGLLRARRGTIRYRGQDLVGMETFQIVRLGIGYMPDEHRIFADLTVEENLELARRVSGRQQGGWTRERVYELFPRLRELAPKRGDQLSGGERKMLAIGRALMNNPGLLLLDEPGEGLAPLVVAELAERLRDIRASGISILLADQNLKFCRRVADRAYVIERGTVRYTGVMEELWDNQDVIDRYLAV